MEDIFGLQYQILQNNQFSILAVYSISEIEPNHSHWRVRRHHWQKGRQFPPIKSLSSQQRRCGCLWKLHALNWRPSIPVGTLRGLQSKSSEKALFC